MAGPRSESSPHPPTADWTLDELWQRYRETRSKELHEELLCRYQPVVRHIAEHMLRRLPRSVDLDDLVQEGLFGLMDAIERYDPDRGYKFKTYAGRRVQGAMIDALRRLDWAPRLQRQRSVKMAAARAEFVEVHGREPSDEELAEILGIPLAAVRRGMPKQMMSVSDRPQQLSETHENPLDGLAESRETDPLDEAHRADVIEILMRDLSEKERTILNLYYVEGLTLRQIGQRLTVTESRVCQIHASILKRLRENLASVKDQLEL